MADKKVSQLVATSTIGDNDLLMTVQGSENKKITGINSKNQFNERWLLQQNPNGFYEDFLPQILSITFDDETRTLTITPAASTFSFFSGGIFFTKTGAQQLILPDSEGLFVIYYDEYGNLLYYLNPDFGWGISILRKYAIVAYLYWDATYKESIYFTAKKELHGINMQGITHAYLHYTEGTKYLEGCQVSDIILGDGDLDRDVQFSVNSGKIQDEDIIISCFGVLYTVGLPIFYLDGASANLRRRIDPGFSVITTGTGRLAYNQWTGSTWQLTEVGNNKYVNYFVFAYNDGLKCFCTFVGQSEYNSKKDAEEAATTEAYTIIKGNFPIQEAIVSAVITFQTSDSYSNTVKGRIVSSLDLTKSNINLALSLNLNHNTLAGLELAAPSDVLWGHVDDILYALFINPDQNQIYHFGEHGDNSNSGLTRERAVADPQTAQNLALAQIPSATNRFVLVCLDAGIYTPPVAVNPWISIYAPNAKFFDGAMEVKDNVNIVIDHYDNNGTIGNYIWKSGTGKSSITIRQVDAKIEVTQGILYVHTNEIIAPTSEDQYLHVLGNTTMYLNAMKVKGEMRIETNGNAYLNIDDTSEFTENFWTTVNVYRNYKDQVNPSINLTTGNFILQPYHEHTRFSNDGATGDVTYQLAPITADMITRGTIYFEVNSETYNFNIITGGADTIRVVDATNTKLRSKSIGNFVGLTVRRLGQWTIENMVGNWELISKT